MMDKIRDYDSEELSGSLCIPGESSEMSTSSQQDEKCPGNSANNSSDKQEKEPCQSNESLCRSDSSLRKLDEDRIVRHIMVVGFHHKHGYQVDYCYPPLEPGGAVFSTPNKPICLPSCWKTLPLLCLPDGSHNYDSDTIFFTMPDIRLKENFSDHNQCSSPTNSQKPNSSSIANDSSDDRYELVQSADGIKTLFGTACYRQIQADKLRNRTDDMTRVAVQKSVCVLSTKPLFGIIRSKLEMITHAYFEELDFSKVKILKLTYENLNSLLSRHSVRDNATFLGLSARHLIAQLGYNVLVLFKAMLLEKKILFYKSPVRDLCSTIISMCSLFTGLLENEGLNHSTCDLQLSPALLEALKLLSPQPGTTQQAQVRDDKVLFTPCKDEVVIIKDPAFADSSNNYSDKAPEVDIGIEAIEGNEMVDLARVSSDYEMIGAEDTTDNEDSSVMADGTTVDDPYALKLCRINPEDCGFPLQIFTRGSFCLPYLSISYLDLLSDSRVRSYVIGATNFLFKQRQEIHDIIVDMEENNVIINDPTLKRILGLTTEDLRFIDYLSKHVKVEDSQPRDEFDLISHDITKWVGGDEWIRYHFRLYTLYMLKASKTKTSLDSFNSGFMNSWMQSTNNYRIWNSSNCSSILDGLQDKHPFGTSSRRLNFSDVKLKLSYAVNSSDKGRIINQTLSGIGKWSIWNNIASAATSATSSALQTVQFQQQASQSTPTPAEIPNNHTESFTNDGSPDQQREK